MALVLAWPGAASASVILARDATHVSLKVDASGRALVSFTRKGVRRHVLAQGAINEDLKFDLLYTSDPGPFADRSKRYDGPQLHWLVVARKAPDGSYWALQAWQRRLPNYGLPASRERAAWELQLSHWRGEIPKLEIHLDWAYKGKFRHLFGRYTYKGKPVFGFDATPTGQPLDPYGRNIYVDTYDSVYGSGWKRENSFLTHRPNGSFCYGFYRHRSTGTGQGTRYRATVRGPGVAPDAYWESTDIGDYDETRSTELRALALEIAGGDPKCKPH